MAFFDPRTTKPEPGHKIYPYLLRGMEIVRPNQVWAMDITYIPMARGFVYLAVVLDWFSPWYAPRQHATGWLDSGRMRSLTYGVLWHRCRAVPQQAKNEDDGSRNVYEICRSGRGSPLRS
jgi:hypothetical protein